MSQLSNFALFGSFALFVGTLFTLIIILAIMGVKFVPQGQQWTVERFGRYTRTLTPGLCLIIPFVDDISRKISMMEEFMAIPSQEVITKDNAMVSIDGVVFFQVLDAAKAAYQVKDLNEAIQNLTMTNIRTVMGSMDLDELLSKRDVINHQLLIVIDEATEPWGIKLLRVEIKDIMPPRDLVESMGRQMKAERDKRASILEAEGKRQADILQAEGRKQAMILQAEGHRQAMILEAEGRREAEFLNADAKGRLAEVEAQAVMILSRSISQGNIQAANYFVAQRYVEALEKIATANNQKIIMMPLEASSIIGSISGISELTKAAFSQKTVEPIMTKQPISVIQKTELATTTGEKPL
ncbi:MAG: hypothetical protein BWK79_05190 [Beggiatoa sp. IS2]|nr:MAG: hypothetical protein BWK79_05190 [Beggiatoa sp. IS2]